MANKTDKTDYRYVNDLRRLAYSQEKSIEQKKFLILLGIAAIFLMLVAVAVDISTAPLGAAPPPPRPRQR